MTDATIDPTKRYDASPLGANLIFRENKHGSLKGEKIKKCIDDLERARQCTVEFTNDRGAMRVQFFKDESECPDSAALIESLQDCLGKE